MVNVYSGTLTAHITNRKMSIPPNGPIDTIEQGAYNFIAIDDGFGREMLLVSSPSILFYSFNNNY